MDFDDNMAGEAPAVYRGLNRYVARKKVLADLELQGLLVKTVPHTHMVPICERTGEVVEYSATSLYDRGVLPPSRILLTAFGSRSGPSARIVENPAGKRR